MLVMVEERELVVAGYEHGFAAEGMALVGFKPSDFLTWIETAPATEVASVEAFLLGDSLDRLACARAIARRAAVPSLAVVDANSLDTTLSLFAEGVDDVVRKPVHVREILARIGAIRRRAVHLARAAVPAEQTGVSVFFDGRDPEIGGVALELPRRERRILEYLIANKGRRVTQDPDLSTRSTGSSTRTSRRTSSRATSASCARSCARGSATNPVDSKRFLGYCIELKGSGVEAQPALQAA